MPLVVVQGPAAASRRRRKDDVALFAPEQLRQGKTRGAGRGGPPRKAGLRDRQRVGTAGNITHHTGALEYTRACTRGMAMPIVRTAATKCEACWSTCKVLSPVRGSHHRGSRAQTNRSMTLAFRSMARTLVKALDPSKMPICSQNTETLHNARNPVVLRGKAGALSVRQLRESHFTQSLGSK